MSDEFSTTKMKDLLWKQLRDVANGKSDYKDANAIAKLSDSICKIKFLELNAARMLGMETERQEVRKLLGIKKTKDLD